MSWKGSDSGSGNGSSSSSGSSRHCEGGGTTTAAIYAYESGYCID